MDDVTFRPATKEDAERLAELVLQLNQFHDDKTVTHTEDYLMQWAHIEAFVVEHGGDIIGYAAGFPTFHFDCATRGYDIQSVCIDAEYRGQGYAKFLIKNLIKIKYSQGIKRFSLSYQTWNEGAQKCYASIGFKERPAGGSCKAVLMGEDLDKIILSLSE